MLHVLLEDVMSKRGNFSVAQIEQLIDIGEIVPIVHKHDLTVVQVNTKVALHFLSVGTNWRAQVSTFVDGDVNRVYVVTINQERMLVDLTKGTCLNTTGEPCDAATESKIKTVLNECGVTRQSKDPIRLTGFKHCIDLVHLIHVSPDRAAFTGYYINNNVMVGTGVSHGIRVLETKDRQVALMISNKHLLYVLYNNAKQVVSLIHHVMEKHDVNASTGLLDDVEDLLNDVGSLSLPEYCYDIKLQKLYHTPSRVSVNGHVINVEDDIGEVVRIGNDFVICVFDGVPRVYGSTQKKMIEGIQYAHMHGLISEQQGTVAVQRVHKYGELFE